MRRFVLSDEQWRRVEGLLPGKAGDPGQTAKDNRLFLDAVLWIVRTGAPWRDLPERLGELNNTFQRFNRWAKRGVWQRIFDAFQVPDLEWVMLEATIIRAHVQETAISSPLRMASITSAALSALCRRSHT